MVIREVEQRRLILVRLNPNDDVLLKIREAVQQSKLENGLVLMGIGSLNRYRFHVVGVPTLPTQDVFMQGEGPFDILSITGAILGGRVHAHITFANTERAMGGHLEEGCRILTFGLVVLAETAGADLSGWDQVGPLEVS